MKRSSWSSLDPSRVCPTWKADDSPQRRRPSAKGFKVNVRTRETRADPAKTVLDQYPVGEARPGRTVTLIVAKKPRAPPPTDKCDPNYSGCVPIASDVDCAGGSGDGPAYVSGPVYVIGSDIYDLDGYDGNGVGCE